MSSNANTLGLGSQRYSGIGTQIDDTPAPRSLDGFVAGPQHARAHPVQRSTTLMRQSVQKPLDGFKRHANTTGHTGTVVKAPEVTIAPKLAAHIVDPTRLSRAGQISRSDYVRRFAAQPIALGRGEMNYTSRVASQTAAAAETPYRQTAATSQPDADIFERALATATSHKETYVPAKHKAKKRHVARALLSVAASLTAVALIVGFVAYQNIAYIQLRLASSNAGINATLPVWKPTGFAMGALTSSSGNVAITYANKTNDQSYTISQSATQWTAETLLSTYVYPNNQTYDTLNSGSTTIYTYGTNNATWVSGGIWYKLVSNGSLSNSQIVNIATSMQS